jgi:hypothetical protein
MKVAQLTVARLYVAGAVSRLPPEVTALEVDSVYPAGKDDAGSSTVCSSVPVSCPEAAASGDCDAVGAGEAEAAGEADAAAEAEAEAGVW